jgi:hypothetical protein
MTIEADVARARRLLLLVKEGVAASLTEAGRCLAHRRADFAIEPSR